MPGVGESVVCLGDFSGHVGWHVSMLFMEDIV